MKGRRYETIITDARSWNKHPSVLRNQISSKNNVNLFISRGFGFRMEHPPRHRPRSGRLVSEPDGFHAVAAQRLQLLPSVPQQMLDRVEIMAFQIRVPLLELEARVGVELRPCRLHRIKSISFLPCLTIKTSRTGSLVNMPRMQSLYSRRISRCRPETTGFCGWCAGEGNRSVRSGAPGLDGRGEAATACCDCFEWFRTRKRLMESVGQLLRIFL